MAEVYSPSLDGNNLRESEEAGTSANAYAAIFDIYPRGADIINMVMLETGTTNGITGKVEVAASEGGTLVEHTEQVIAAGSSWNWNSSIPWGRVKVSVKSTVGGAHGTYETQMLVTRNG